METSQGGQNRAREQDSDRDTWQQGAGCKERLKQGREEAETGVGRGPRENKRRRQEGEGVRRAAGAQPLPPWLPQCQAGLCIPKASPETPACWSTKPRSRKGAKLEGSRVPAAGEACPQEGGSGTRRQCPVSCPPITPPPHPTQSRDSFHTQQAVGWMGSPAPRPDSGVSAGDKEREWLRPCYWGGQE